MIIAMRKLVLGLPVVAGVTVALVAPASAVGFSTSGSVIEFCSDGINTFSDGEGGRNCSDGLGTILSGNSAAPGGNVELGGNDTEDISLTQFMDVETSSLTADFSDNSITFSSLTFDDWFGVDGSGNDTSFGANNFANRWFTEGLNRYGNTIRSNPLLANPLTSAALGLSTTSTDAELFNAFRDGLSVPGLEQTGTGFGRFSDPNVAYVTENADSYTFGLAGHQDAGNLFPLFAGLSASEVVKVTQGSSSKFFYSFDAPTDSGQTGLADGVSHNANFEFTVAKSASGELPESVPEPASLLGLAAVGGLVAVRKRLQK